MKTVYYLPGYGGRLATGLGEGLAERGWDIAGRETVGEFRDMPFRQQVDTVADDLQRYFWYEEARVVAVSFGAYLFLHAQAQLPRFVGRVLLLSPIVGQFSNEATGANFLPPFAERLGELATAGCFNAPARCHIHVGADDWQSCPANVREFAGLVCMGVTVAPGRGHQLGKDYVGPLLDTWLAS